MKKAAVIESLNVPVIIVLAYASISKLIHHQTFLGQLMITPSFQKMAVGISWIIPVAELLIAIMMVIKRLRKTGLYFSVILFAFYMIAQFLFKFYIPFIIGGLLIYLDGVQHFVLNALLFLLSVASLLLGVLQSGKERANRLSAT